MNIFKRDSLLLQHGLVMFASLLIARFFGYLFQVYVARSLGPEEYGIFGSLFAIFMLLSIPTGTIQTVVSRFTSEYKVNSDYGLIKKLYFSSIKQLSFYGIIAIFLVTLISFPLAAFLKIPTVFSIIILGFSVIWSFVLPVPEGVLSGLQNFRWLGTASLLNTLSRFLIMILFLAVGLKLNGVLLSFVLAPLIPFLICLIPLRELLKQKDSVNSINVSSIYYYSYPILIVIGLSMFMQNFSILAIKHFFSSYDTGIYVAACNISMVVIFLGAALTSSQFPKISDLHSLNSDAKHILKESLIYMVSFSFSFVIGCTLFRRTIVSILFGEQYADAVNLLPVLCVAMSIFAVSTLLINYSIAIKKFSFVKLIMVVIFIHVLFMFIFNKSINMIILNLLISYIAVLIIMAFHIFHLK